MDKKYYHILNEIAPLGKKPHETEVRHPELPGLVSKKDERQQRQRDNQLHS